MRRSLAAARGVLARNKFALGGAVHLERERHAQHVAVAAGELEAKGAGVHDAVAFVVDKASALTSTSKGTTT